jgi:hypothetical protein
MPPFGLRFDVAGVVREDGTESVSFRTLCRLAQRSECYSGLIAVQNFVTGLVTLAEKGTDAIIVTEEISLSFLRTTSQWPCRVSCYVSADLKRKKWNKR